MARRGDFVAAGVLFYARIAIVEPIQNWQADDLAINYSAATVLRSGGSIYDSIGPPGAALMTWGLAMLWGLMLWRLRAANIYAVPKSFQQAKG